MTTLNVNVLLQIAANKRYPIALGDLKNAFCQSAPLNRETGEIYFEIPSDGLDGMDHRQLILIVDGCYGLVDAPLHWRKSLVSKLEQLGYVQSRMDPCLFKLHHQKQLSGMVAIEVDDLLTAGDHIHEEKMKKLRSIYQFGKWVELQKTENGASFNGRRLQQEKDFTVKIDMKKFVEERLKMMILPPDRKKAKDSEITEEERKEVRMICGALNWLSKEGRPDASAAASLCSSKINRMKIEDVLMMNEAVKEIKENSGLEIRIQPLKKMRLAVVTDASFGNHDFHSQAGQMILSHEDGLREGRKVTTNLLWWRSGKLQRVVNSTLAAETQSLSKGLGDLMWALVLFRELQEEKMVLRDWARNLRHEEILALASSQSDGQLKSCMAIVDAKSLFDYLAKETIGGQDRRTAIEVQIIREDLNALSGEIRWVDHQSMVADCLTKLKGTRTALFRLLATGCFSIQAEEKLLHDKKEERLEGRSTADIRKNGLRDKENFGSCDLFLTVQPQHVPQSRGTCGPTPVALA